MHSLQNLLSAGASFTRASFRNSNSTNGLQVGWAVAGASLLLTGALVRRSILTVGLTVGGVAMLYKALNGKGRSGEGRISTFGSMRGVNGNPGCKIVRTIRINAAPKEIFRFVRNLENAPHYLEGVESVQILDDRRSHWTARTPTGSVMEWYQEVIDEGSDEMISWQSLEASDVHHTGSIRFEARQDGSTDVKVALEFLVDGHDFERKVAKVLGHSPEAQLAASLGRLKNLVESGTEQVRIPDFDLDSI